MRKLASLRRVLEISPIENADAIEVARIDGWQCVVKKGEFRKDDLGVYFEIDSFLPIEERYEFLRKSSYKKLLDESEGFRLKTVKLRGVISQGLLMPVTSFPEITGAKEGDDVTEALHVTQYEPPLPANLAGVAKGLLPPFIKKTDQERIQNLPEYLTQFGDLEFECTIKLDGSSMSVYYREKEGGRPEMADTGVCSRGIDLKEDEKNTYWRIAKKLLLLEILRSYQKNIALQGEAVGESIQSNNEKLKGQNCYLFDIWDIDLRRHLTMSERLKALEELNQIARTLGGEALLHVPILGKFRLKDWISQLTPGFLSSWTTPQIMDALLKTAEGTSLNPKAEREGLVFKSTQVVNGEIISFKVLSNKYLLKEK
jgi:RNA ligase (TIGR02306 family)